MASINGYSEKEQVCFTNIAKCKIKSNNLKMASISRWFEKGTGFTNTV